MWYHFEVHKDKIGYWAECVELSGCYTQGDSKQELYANIQEALDLYLDKNKGVKFLTFLEESLVAVLL